MFRVRYFVSVVSLAVFTPFPTWQHFIWPLDWCVLADFCNHTWIPECGIANDSKGKVHFRLFIDECDMFEYNCDFNKSYEITNYSLCYGPACLGNDDNEKVLRIGDYKVVGRERKMVYDPTNAWGQPIYTTTTKRITFPTTTRPNLPKHMLRGRRRFTPHGPFWGRRYVEPEPRKRPTANKRPAVKTKSTTKKMNTITIPRTTRTIVIKKVTFRRKNKTFVRVYKGVAMKVTSTTKLDDDFLE